jgi:hypothetical protein
MGQEDNDSIRVAKRQQSIDGLLRLVLKPSLSNHRNHRPFNFSACALCPFVPSDVLFPPRPAARRSSIRVSKRSCR